MSRYDVEQRAKIVAGPHYPGSGITQTHYDPADPQSRAPVEVALDSSTKIVTCLSCELRPDVYQAPHDCLSCHMWINDHCLEHVPEAGRGHVCDEWVRRDASGLGDAT